MRNHEWPTVAQMVAMEPEELAAVDPVAMNLIVAKGIPSLAELEIEHYVRQAEAWGDDLLRRMPYLEGEFQKTPEDWGNDLGLFKLGHVCWYLETILGISYREDQRHVTRIRYTDPNDLFLCGVMDTGRGTCATLSLLNVVIGRRIGLPVSLACVGSHFICRYDDGKVCHNLEATQVGCGGFSSQTDQYILDKHKLPPVAKTSGSDLRAVTPHEMLGLFVGCRARHLENIGCLIEAEPDYLLARYLFLNNRNLWIAQNQISVQTTARLFEPGEKGHPTELAKWLQEVVQVGTWNSGSINPSQSIQEKINGRCVDEFFGQISVGIQ